MPDSNQLLDVIREYAQAVIQLPPAAPAQDPARHLASHFFLLDRHLTNGGRPPEVWVEGPDAPEIDDPDAVAALSGALERYDAAAEAERGHVVQFASTRAAGDLADAARTLLARIDEAVAR